MMTTENQKRDQQADLSAARQELLKRKLGGLKAKAKAKVVEEDSIPKRSGNDNLPLSYEQQRLWYMHQLNPQATVYNLMIAMRLKGNLHEDALAQALNQIVDRHEVLRTMFVEEDGIPRQLIREEMEVPLLKTDLSSLSFDKQDKALNQYIAEFYLQPFELGKDHLIRAQLFRIKKDEYVLALLMHHSVFDGWSSDVLTRELSFSYNALSEHNPSSLPVLPLQYADYAIWQRKRMAASDFDEHLKYWCDQLQGELPTLHIPTDYRRPLEQTGEGGSVSLELDKETCEKLRFFSHEQNCTLSLTTLAAYFVLLYRYTGQEDIIVGQPVAGREHSDLTNLIGSFVNTLPIRMAIDGSLPFSQFLHATMKQCLRSYEHRSVPFDRIVEAIRPRRDLSRTPVFQVLFNFRREQSSSIAWSGLFVELLPIERKVARTDLMLDLEELQEGIRITAEYNTDVFDSKTIVRMLANYQELLKSILNNPALPISVLPILASEERRCLLYEWNQTAIKRDETMLLHKYFENQVNHMPDKEAVVFGDERLSYRGLNERANLVAHRLQELGVKPGTLVGLCINRSLEMIVGLLGILKAGGAYVPMDPTYPSERVAFMIEQSQAPVIVTSKECKETLPDEGIYLLNLDEEKEFIADHLAEKVTAAPEVVLTSEQLAYVIFTSGSTGLPKGVQIPHGAVVNFLNSMARTPGLTERDRVMAVTTLSFDISMLELFLPLLVGATTIIAGQDIATDGTMLASELEKHSVTMMQATPSTWRLLLMADWSGGAGFKALCGGEALPADLAEQLLGKVDEVWNMYGPTETTVWSTCHRIERADQPILIGKPIANTQCFVFDDSMNPVPVGVPGELYIGGDGLAAGYLNREDLTAERFVETAISGRQLRLYRTGDLVRWRPSGDLEYLRRIDNQVKVRGFRIELGEIETVLRKHDAVEEAIVIVREYSPGDQRLAAYMTTLTGKDITITEMRKYLRKFLPKYMIPQYLEMLAEMPLTPNGKIDKNALPAPMGFAVHTTNVIPPQTPAQSYLAALWSDVIGVEAQSIEDNFFEIGGHSLLAAKVAARVKREVGIAIPLQSLVLSSLQQITDSYFPADWSMINAVSDVENAIPDNGKGFSGFFNRLLKRGG